MLRVLRRHLTTKPRSLSRILPSLLAKSPIDLPSILIEQALTMAAEVGATVAAAGGAGSGAAAPIIIDGKATADTIRGELAERVKKLTAEKGRVRRG